MSESLLIPKILQVVMSMRDVEYILEEDMSEDFSEGYRQALDDLAQWLWATLHPQPQALRKISAAFVERSRTLRQESARLIRQA
jgi:hypothetical protein